MEENTTHLWQMYEKGIDYQNNLGIRKNIPMYIDFYEGRQWPAVTENTKNLPRPVVNIIKMICRNKKSAILSAPVRISYKSYDANVDAEKFNSFASDIQKEIFQNELDRMAMDDGVKKGSFFYHYYWDKNAVGKDGNIDGALRCELIDPLNIFFSNPYITDEQKQKWILISSHENIDTLLGICDTNLTYDDLAGDIDKETHDMDKICTVLTRYFKKDGEIYCERGTKSHIINTPFPISPDFESISEELDIKENLLPKNQKSTLYPIVSGFYERREKSMYGIGEVEGLIPNQKAINFNIAMSLLNAQEVAWGKYIALPNALKGQKITNVPGQVLIDYSGTGDGIKRMGDTSNMPSAPMEIVDTLASLTRSVSGSTEIMTGETTSSSMSGVAISYLQSQAQLPLEDLRNAFAHVKRKQGLVLAQFFKQFYFEKEFRKSVLCDNGSAVLKKDLFSSAEFQDADFDVIVEITSGSKTTIASDISMLNECLEKDKISIETYIRSYPDCAISNKNEILKQLEMEKSSTMSQLYRENEDLKARLEKACKDINEQKNAFDDITSIIDENNRLKEFIALNIK